MDQAKKRKIKKFKLKKLTGFTLLPVLVCMACFLINPARYTKLVLEGATLWAVCVLPATLPFLFLTALVTRHSSFSKFAAKLSRPTGKLFRISGAGGLCALLSALSGYPVGAKSVFDLHSRGMLAKEETFRTACLASTSGPMFLVGAVGAGMFKSVSVGWLLYLSHLLGIFLVCFFMRFTKKKARFYSAPAMLPAQKTSDALSESVLSVLTVGGAIAVYYALAGMVCDFIALTGLGGGYVTPVVTGLIEMTSGCSLLAQTPTALNCALACFLVTFGGGCVLTQQTGYLSRANVNRFAFAGVKLLQAVCAFLFMLLFCLIFGL